MKGVFFVVDVFENAEFEFTAPHVDNGHGAPS
jgi:hypothetical protein